MAVPAFSPFFPPRKYSKCGRGHGAAIRKTILLDSGPALGKKSTKQQGLLQSVQHEA